jgi:hypothetical protein
MREWSIKLFLLDEEGKEHPANCFQKIVYNLHPTFERPVQSRQPSPYLLLVAVCLTDCSFHQAAVHLHQRGMGRVRSHRRLLHHREAKADHPA